MDNGRFDNWAKLAGRRQSRRLTIQLLAGAIPGLAAGLFDNRADAAKKKRKPKPKKCRPGQKRCGRFCIASKLCCISANCPDCQECSAQGTCVDQLLEPLCNACQGLKCVNKSLRCAPVKDGTACGEFCCEAPDTCCPGWRGCKSPDPVCGACKKPCGDICCDLTQTCRRNADLSYVCI